MGDQTATKDKSATSRGLDSASRGTGAASRGLDNALAGRRRARRRQTLLNREALGEEMRRSRQMAEREQQREAKAARRRRPADDVRIKPASSDPFGAREVGAENVPDPRLRQKPPERAGFPLAPPGVVDLELETALAEILRRRGKNPPTDPRMRNVVQLGDLFNAIPKQTRERILAALLAPKKLKKIKVPEKFSLAEGIRLLGRTKIGALRRAGATVPSQYGDELPLNHAKLKTLIYYVGPGVGVLFTPTGDMVEFPFGPAFDVEAVHEWAKPHGGMFFSISRRETIQLFPVVKYQEGLFRIRTGGPTREYRAVRKKTDFRPILFIVSPSYFNRRGMRKAFTGLPERAWDAASIALDEDNNYVLYAAGDQVEQIENMGIGDIAGMIVELAIDVLSPLPSYEDIQDAKRLGRANIMAMWGADGAHINSDLDIAARLYAREVAAQILGIAIGGARKVAKKIDGSVRQSETPQRTQTGTQEPSTVDAPEANIRSQEPGRSADVSSPTPGGKRSEAELTVKQQADAARLAQRELDADGRRLIDDGASPARRATTDPVDQRDRKTGDDEAERPDRPRREGPPSGGRPRSHRLDKETLDKARKEHEMAAIYDDLLPASREQKTTAHSEGQYSESGYTYKGRWSEHAQRRAATGESESAYYVGRYEELSGRRPPRGNDNENPGDAYAAHAEVKDRVHQFEDGTNHPTGVSRNMCGHCRRWHRDTAVKQKEQIVVADPSYTRAFNPDGTVDIYSPDGDFLRTIPANAEPIATGKSYEGVPW